MNGLTALERRCLVVGAVLMASGVAHLIVFAVRGGPWDGPVSFRKAVTFGTAFGVTIVTITLVQRMITLSERMRRVTLPAFVAACVVEVFLVSLQSWRQVPSHFNRATGFDSAVSTVLAIGGAVIVVTALLTTFAALRRPVRAAPAMALAVRAGYVGFTVALLVGVLMIVRGVTAVSPAEAYHHAGSLKPAHADTMHAILVMPLLAWLLERGDWRERTRVRLVALAAAGYGLTAVLVLIESLRGIDPLAPGAATLVSALGVAILVAVGATALARALRWPDGNPRLRRTSAPRA